MSLFTIKKTTLALSLCFSYALLCHSDEIESRISSLESRMGAVKTRTAKGTTGAKLATGRPLTDGYGLFGTADLLFWHLKEGGTEYALKSKNQALSQVHGNAKHVNFDWDFGFRLGVGYLFEHDEWDTQFFVTWFQTDAHNSARARTNGTLFPQIGFALNEGKKASLSWNTNYFVIDLELARTFFVSKFLVFRPLVGFETAWINQHREFKEHYILSPGQNQSQLIVKGRNNFWGIGPRIGLDSTWYFNPHFSLFGNINTALLVGDFDVIDKEKEKGNIPVKLTNVNADFIGLVPNIKAILGLQWDTNFNDNCNHIGIKLGYEFQYWWKQNQMLNVNSTSVPQYQRESEDLSINGITLNVRFDF